MANWTYPQDIEDRWVGDDYPEDKTELVEALILDAELIIKSEYPKIQERIDDNKLDIEIIKLVVARMVTRVLKNPEGLTYIQNTVGPYSQARNYGSGAGTDMWLTAEEKEILSATKGTKIKSHSMLDASREAYEEEGVTYYTGIRSPFEDTGRWYS